VPPNVTEAADVLLVIPDIEESYGLQLPLIKPVIATTEFIDDFSDETTLKITIFLKHCLGWQLNGGVVPDNVF
jgi:hypothetical protein